MQNTSLRFALVVAVSVIWAVGCTVLPETETSTAYKDLKPAGKGFPAKLALPSLPSRPSQPTTLGPQGPPDQGVSLASKAEPSAELHVAAARMAERSGQPAEAAKHYQKALAVDPGHVGALLGYGRLKESQQQPLEAFALYQKAAKAHPNDASVFNALGLNYARQRKFKESIATLERAIRLDPKEGLYRNNIAMVLVEIGDAEAALSHLKAVQSDAVAHYNVGYILQKKGDSDAAAHHFAMAVKEDPSLSEAGAWLAKLQAEKPGVNGPGTQMASPGAPRAASSNSRIASKRPTSAGGPQIPPNLGPPPGPGGLAPLPPVLNPPQLVPAKSGVQKLPPVPPPLTLPNPSTGQAGPAPLPPPSSVGQDNQPGGSPGVQPLPPVEDNSDLP